MKQRVISAVIALLITVPLLLLGGIWFKILVSILGIIGLWEVLRIRDIPNIMKIVSYVMFLVVLLFGYNYTISYTLNYSIVILLIFTLFLPILLYHNDSKYNVLDCLYLFGWIIFLSSAFNLFIYIREIGITLFVYLFLITSMTDTFAYIMGSKFGKRKLMPSISPNKSVEGAIYGGVFGTLIAVIFYALAISSSNLISVIIVTFILSCIGQCGDLIFSSVKRHFKIKDFSNIMPGHGGILDRLDSIIFVLLGYVILSTIL